MNTVAIIPARGGSTRIPRKNLALLAGEPLLVHTIRAARKAKEVNHVLVSTNDQEIADTAVQHGAEIIWRPEDLATATSPTEPALHHAVKEFERIKKQPVEIVVMLQPTSPLRGAKRIDQAIQILRQTGCDAVVSVVPDIHYYFLHEVGSEGKLHVGYNPQNRLRTQDIPPQYRENGAIYVMTRTQLMERGCRMGGDMRALIMDEYESVDIDGPLDLLLCEAILSYGPCGKSC